MKIRTHKFITALAAFVVLVAIVVGWFVAAPLRGRVAAHYDVMRGRYVRLTYGLPVEWLSESNRLLRDRYHIESRAVGTCTVSSWTRSFADAYDAVSMEAATRHFGHDVFRECDGEARRRWEAMTPMERMFPDAGPRAETADCFRSFTRKNRVYDVVRACGRPDSERCSGAFCFVWNLKDDSYVVLRTGDLDGIGELRVRDASHEESLLRNEFELLPRSGSVPR